MKVAADSCLGSGGGDGGCGESVWPPGFRFHPTDEELVAYYLKKKICKKKHKIDVIRELDVYKWDPEELPGQSLLKTGDRQWFFFSPRDRKYPNAGRSNRATRQGFWKATGKDRSISCNSRPVGVKKTLVFYRGRAPKGERTDWVMHEYTLDEEELKRCPDVKEYYALYKAFKKSGPGPKNGEQYGAVFKEEEWDDDELANARDSVTPDVHIEKHVVEVVSDNSVGAVGQVDPLFDDLDDILRGFVDGPALDLPQSTNHASMQLQVASKEVAESTLYDPSIRGTFNPDPSSSLPTSAQDYDDLFNCDFNQSSNSGLQLQEALEVTSDAVNLQQSFDLSGEDFLEIDDLENTEPTSYNTEEPSKKLQFDCFDGLGELDLYHDARMFLHDMGVVDQEIIYQPYNDTVVNNVECWLEQHSGAGEMVGNQNSVNGHGANIVAPSEANNLAVSQTSGFACESTNNPNRLHENQNDKGSNGWVSSVLWSFVESIPTTPASASENPLVNKALERISSFSRVKVNIKNIDLAAASKSSVATVKRTNGNRIIVLLAVVGALCAMLWMFGW